MTALLTNQELGIPDTATTEERAAALAAAAREHLAIMARKPSQPEKEHGTKH
jgi:hypothetical protein